MQNKLTIIRIQILKRLSAKYIFCEKLYCTIVLISQLSLPSKINPNPDLPAAFIPFFRRIFFMAYAMKIHLKKNAAANGLEFKDRLQGLTATDVTHSRKSKAAILIFYIWPCTYCENPPFQITKHRLLIKSRNKTGISAPSDLHSPVASLCFYSYIKSFFFSFFFLCSRSFLSFV